MQAALGMDVVIFSWDHPQKVLQLSPGEHFHFCRSNERECHMSHTPILGIIGYLFKFCLILHFFIVKYLLIFYGVSLLNLISVGKTALQLIVLRKIWGHFFSIHHLWFFFVLGSSLLGEPSLLQSLSHLSVRQRTPGLYFFLSMNISAFRNPTFV